MPGIFGHLLTRKYHERQAKEQRAAEFYGSTVRDYFAGKSDLDDDSAQFAIEEFQKLLPKEQQESFKTFVAAKLGQRRLAGGQGQSNQPAATGGLPAPPATSTGGLTPPPPGMMPGMVGEATAMGADIEGTSTPNNVPLPPPMVQASQLGQQGFSASTPAPASARPAQLPPPPFMRRDPMQGSAYQVAGVEAMVEEAKRIGLTDPKDIVNFINNKQVDRDPTKQGVLTGGPGTVFFDPATGQVKYTVPFKPDDPYKEVSPGAALFDTRSGKSVFQAPPKPDDPNSPFAAWYQRFRAENGREPTTAEVKSIEQQFSPSYGPPLYVTVGPDGTPVYTPRNQASGMPAARTVFDEQGNPSTGGRRGVSLTPPPTISQGTQQELAGMKNIIGQFEAVKPFIDRVQGPLMGRVTLAEVEKLGGMGASPEEMETAVRLRNLVTTQAFSNGGKQLTGTEKEEFIANSPALTDTVQQAAIKYKIALEILNRNYQNRLSTMPSRQRNQLTPPPSSSSIKVTVGGRTWTFDSQEKADAFKQAAGVQ